jgi:general secretion pathway protein G
MSIPNHREGFTLIELSIVTVIIGVLVAMAVPKFSSQVDNARSARAMVDLRTLEKEIGSYLAFTDDYPENLGEIGRGGFLDPWGRPYEYTKIANTGEKPKGVRKDHFMVPVNSDYDLFSRGVDGESAAPFTAAKSLDDIVRANNGSYVGLAQNY